MATAGPMVTPTDADILTLTQWLSPAYPIGGFAYSHGLEWAIDCGDVSSAADVQGWIEDVVKYGTGWNDCLFLFAAFGAVTGDEVAEIDAQACAFCASAERLKETQLLGQAFCDVTAEVWSLDLFQLTYPVAVGVAARMQNLPVALTAKLFLQGFMGNLVACATRLVPLGQTESQRLIRKMTPVCASVAEEAMNADLNDLRSTTFLPDIASMRHETQYSRIFRT
ncbi:urease accessory protein UreF [Ruegeria sp. ANG-S4]|uniref:urease accessory protein UreF n=1 Tax=Ruegeria sp. ANG-S4 TaxID=1577904 RepID=UPI000A9EEBF4|nr:urease accessory protein UreF [Ruegeria sp. ANG-S4]